MGRIAHVHNCNFQWQLRDGRIFCFLELDISLIDFIKYIASLEGVALDPVYTGKAFYGLYNEIKKGNLSHHKNILFIHTGGIFGWKAEQRDIIKNF